MVSFFPPFTRHFAMLLLTTCAAEKIYLGLPFSLILYSPPPEPRSLPASASSIFILHLSLSLSLPLPLSFGLSSSLSLPLSHCVTHSMALIHQLVLRADNGRCHIAKGKPRHRATVSENQQKSKIESVSEKRETRERERQRYLYGCSLWKC